MKVQMSNQTLFKYIGIIVSVFILIALVFYFVVTRKRSNDISYLSSNSFVTAKDFSSFPQGLIAAWTAHLKKLDMGSDVSILTFSWNGNNYNIRNGNKE